MLYTPLVDTAFCSHRRSVALFCIVPTANEPECVHNFNRLVSVAEKQCVYCEVGSESLNIIQTNVRPCMIRAVDQVASRRHSMWKPGFNSMSVHVMCVCVLNRVAMGRDFFRVLRISPVNIIAPLLHTHLHLRVARTRTNGRSLETYISSTGQQSRPAFICYASEA